MSIVGIGALEVLVAVIVAVVVFGPRGTAEAAVKAVRVLHDFLTKPP